MAQASVPAKNVKNAGAGVGVDGDARIIGQKRRRRSRTHNVGRVGEKGRGILCRPSWKTGPWSNY